MTVPAFRAIASAIGSGADADTVPVATNVNNDTLFFVAGTNAHTPVIDSGMSAWSVLYESVDVTGGGTTLGAWLYWKIAASEPATYAPNFSLTNTRWMHTVSFQGAHATTPVEDHDIAIQLSNTTITSTSVTSDDAERLFVIIALARLAGTDPLWNDISGMTTHFNDTAGGIALIVASEAVNAGAVQKTLTHNGSACALACFSVILEPASMGSPPSSAHSQLIMI